MGLLDKLKPMAPWILRAPLAGVFLFHGIMKLPMAEGMSKMMGMPLVVVYILAVAETVAGASILLGKILKNKMLTRLSGGIITVVMLGAIKMAHWGQWSFAPSASHPMGGMEFQFTLMCLGLYFLITAGDD